MRIKYGKERTKKITVKKEKKNRKRKKRKEMGK